MNDKRHFERHKTLKGARITFHGGHSSIDCVVRNLSNGGARVMLESSIGIPDEVMLVINDGTQHQARIVRRKINELGLQFTDTASAA